MPQFLNLHSRRENTSFNYRINRGDALKKKLWKCKTWLKASYFSTMSEEWKTRVGLWRGALWHKELLYPWDLPGLLWEVYPSGHSRTKPCSNMKLLLILSNNLYIQYIWHLLSFLYMQGVQELWMYQEKWIRAVDLEEFNCTMRANVGLPQWLRSKECACNAGNGWCGFDTWIRKTPWRRKWQPISLFLPEKSNGLRSLLGYSQTWLKNKNESWITDLESHTGWAGSCVFGGGVVFIALCPTSTVMLYLLLPQLSCFKGLT